MNTYIDKCCEKCWHSAEKPCEKFVVCCHEGPLCHTDSECSKKIDDLHARLLLEKHEVPIIHVGMGTCGLASGADKVYNKIIEILKKHNIDAKVVPTGCVGYCAKEVIVDIKMPGQERVSYSEITEADVEKLIESHIVNKSIWEEKLLGVYCDPKETNSNHKCIYEDPFFKLQEKIVLENAGIINPESIDEYIAHDGYFALNKVLRTMKPEDVIQEVLESGLRGRGGGGFPAGKKWQFAAQQKAGQKYVVCNADEGDPGAFMDRAVLEGDPHRLIEGMIIAGYAIGASVGYIYCRAEYPLAIERLTKTIEQAKSYGLLGKNILGSGFNFEIKIKKGAGAFVCGEETALLHSIEGKRGMPRPRPPFPAVEGLFGQPTIINNVETFSNVPSILRKGSEWFASIGTETSKGTKVFALSGKIKNTGLIEVPMGVTLREVIFNIGGGIPNGKSFKAVQIGGPSGGCLPESVIDTPIDYESLKDVGAMMGSGGLVVMDEDTCMVDVAKFFMTFIQSESCGKCIPCREGTKRLLEIVDRITKSDRKATKPEESLERFRGMIYLERLSNVIKDSSLCGLGQTAPNPVLSTLHYFREEYEAHLYDKKCPAKQCADLLTFTIDNEKCTGCTACARKCPQNAIVGEKKKAHYIIEDKCIGCDMCRQTCKFDAVLVN
ncbi:MAG: NADH-quinone oxidoreductase subunit NuoF [Calditrichia bacterium]